MATFVRGQPIKTTAPTITVDAGLALGSHRFQLVVTTDTGQTSAPAVVTVDVIRSLIDPVRPVLEPVLVSPVPVSPTLTTPTTRLDTTLVTPRSAPARKSRKPRSES